MIRKIESIEQLNAFLGEPTYHPQVSVCNLSNAHEALFEPTDFGADGG